MAQLKAGDKAPDFSLPDQDSNAVRLSDFRGHVVLLYFYPKADTPGCTAQAVSVRDAHEELQRSDVTAIGISPDLPQKQNKFAGKYNLGFRLLSDPDHKTADDYGVWGEKSMYGKKYEGIVRSSFLIDEEGKVIGTWYKVSPKDTVPKARLALSSRKK
jgi:thioredoxin-dependent peroxiredoxin